MNYRRKGDNSLKILVLVHGYPPTAMAGTELCAQRLCAGLRGRGHEVSVVAREEMPGFPEYKMTRDRVDGIPVLRVVNNFTRLQKKHLFDYHPRFEEIFAGEISRTGPDIVHIQHLAGASWGIPSMVKKRGLPLVVSLHDYWYACERVQLLRPDGSLCRGPERGRNCALYCARSSLSYLGSAVFERFRGITGRLSPLPGERAALAALSVLQRGLMPVRTRRLRKAYRGRCSRLLDPLSTADFLVSPSEKARSIYTAMGVPGERHVVIPHGLPPLSSSSGTRWRAAYDGTKPLEVGYVGNLMEHKGIITLLRAMKKLLPREARLTMYGKAYPPRYERFLRKAVKRFPPGQVAVRGTYTPAELPRIFAGIDILVLPALWHETFNLVLWEAWAAGVPVLASCVGALADFIREGVNGVTFSPGNWRDLRAILLQFIRDPGLLAKLRENLPRYCGTLDENAGKYEKLYEELVSG